MENWTVDRNTGCLTLSYNNEPFICSFEIGDWLSTVSAGNTQKSASHNIVKTSVTQNKFEATHRVDLVSGTAFVDQKEHFGNGSLQRQFRVTPAGTVNFGDFVIRFVRDAASIDHVEIGGCRFEHRGRNRHLQFGTDSIVLAGFSNRVRITIEDTTLPHHVEPVIYARDEPSGDWIVHVRALTTEGPGFLRLYRGPVDRLPVLDSIVDGVDGIEDALRYIRERATLPGRWIPLQYVHTTELTSDDDIWMAVNVDFDAEI